MSMNKTLIAGALAGLALLVTTGGAFAAPAVATTNVNVRSGPGANFRVIDTLRRGERVEVQQCRGSWCFVEKRGPDGWVSANYLDRGGRPGRPGWDRPGRPDWGWDRPGRPGWDRPGRPDWGWGGRPGRPGSQVCYRGPNGFICVGR